MSFKKKLRVLAVCLILEAGVLMHCPMRPEESEEIMLPRTQPKLAHQIPTEDDEGGDGDNAAPVTRP